jgi:hypothetical protein
MVDSRILYVFFMFIALTLGGIRENTRIICGLMFVVPYILVTYAFIQFQLDVLYALFLS